MNRVTIPEFETKKELFAYLKQNKESLIAKKSEPFFADVLKFSPSVVQKSAATKSNEPIEDESLEELDVKLVCNSTRVLDSHQDALFTGCYDKTIEEHGDKVVHLHDHVQRIDGKVGEVQQVYTEDISLRELGFDQSGKTECYIMKSRVIKEYNQMVFRQYRLGKINQHSIGLRYVQIDLAIDDEDSEKEKEFFDKYVVQLINPEKAYERGYFWVVKEVEVLENSAVLWGSNPATPTLDNGSGSKGATLVVNIPESAIKLKRNLQKLRLRQRQIFIEG